MSAFQSADRLAPIAAAQQLRELMSRPGIIQLPGVYDCLSAKIAQETGFSALYTSGFSISASYLGMPDVGLLTGSENVQMVSNIVRCVDIPVVADCDTGYGNAVNVGRLVQDMARAGVAGVCLEDQVWPKKCGHFAGKQCIPAEEHAIKIRAAAEARGNSGLVIFARTDARAPLGLDEALRRARLYKEAGADVVFVEAPQSTQELQRIAQELSDVYLLANFIEGGKTPIESATQLEGLGYKFVMYSTSSVLAATRALRNVLGTIFNKGATHEYRPNMESFPDFLTMIGLHDTNSFEKRHVLAQEAAVVQQQAPSSTTMALSPTPSLSSLQTDTQDSAAAPAAPSPMAPLSPPAEPMPDRA